MWIVCSTENNCYTAWQAQTLAYSAVRQGYQVMLVVHDALGKKLHPGYREAKRIAEVVPAKSYRGEYGYAPRNTAGTLLEAARVLPAGERMLLVDPDMLVVRPFAMPDGLTGTSYPYVDYALPVPRRAARELGLDPDSVVRDEALSCGAPYSISVAGAEELAETWLRITDRLLVLDGDETDPPGEQVPEKFRWTLIMYGFGLAVRVLRQACRLNELSQDNWRPSARLERPIVHYCFSTSEWSKRSFPRAVPTPGVSVWEPPPAPAGTVHGELFALLRAAGDFYRTTSR